MKRPYLIWSTKWSCWWRANNQGYTQDIERAGRYTEAEVRAMFRGGLSDEREEARLVKEAYAAERARLHARRKDAKEKMAAVDAVLDQLDPWRARRRLAVMVAAWLVGSALASVLVVAAIGAAVTHG